MKKSNDDIYIIESQLKTGKERREYLLLLISRMDETKRILNKTLFCLSIFALTFFLLSNSKIQGISFPPFDKIDGYTILMLLPSIFSLCYYYYIIVWINYVQQRKIYFHLTSIIFNIEINSHLNDHIMPFSFTDLLVKHNTSKSRNFLGYITNVLLIPIFIFFYLSPIIFVCYAIVENIKNNKTYFWQDIIIFFVPAIVFLCLILILIRLIRINILGKE